VYWCDAGFIYPAKISRYNEHEQKFTFSYDDGSIDTHSWGGPWILCEE
jgi:hypothetical protein